MNLSEAYFENAQPRALCSRFEGYIITLLYYVNLIRAFVFTKPVGPKKGEKMFCLLFDF